MTIRTPIAALIALAACAPHVEPARRDDNPRPIRSAKPSEAELHKELTPVQYNVTQRSDTEVPFHNEYWDNHAAGLYVDITTGQPLFTSREKAPRSSNIKSAGCMCQKTLKEDWSGRLHKLICADFMRRHTFRLLK